MNIEQIKENIKCPQFGDLEYGKWGALRFEQREAFKHLIDIVEELEQENKKLKVKSDVLEESNKLLIQHQTQMYEDLDIAYERIDKTIELTKNLLKTEERGYYQILFKEILKSLGDKENE